MRWVLGFDGGGTKTDCVLMDESGAVVARARSGASNPTSFGVEVSLASLAEAAKDALRTAGRSEKDVAYLVAGISDLSADRKSTRLNFSHAHISYAVFCL